MIASVSKTAHPGACLFDDRLGGGLALRLQRPQLLALPVLGGNVRLRV